MVIRTYMWAGLRGAADASLERLKSLIEAHIPEIRQKLLRTIEDVPAAASLVIESFKRLTLIGSVVAVRVILVDNMQ